MPDARGADLPPGRFDGLAVRGGAGVRSPWLQSDLGTMAEPHDDPDGLLIARALDFARRELGPASERWVREEPVRRSILARLCRGTAIDDAVLAEVHAAAGRNREVADEFLAHFLPELARAGRRVRSAELRRFLDTGDLVQSVLGDAWPKLTGARFTSRTSFLSFLLRRLRWKAADKARALEAGKRREDRRLEVSVDALAGVAPEAGPLAEALKQDECENLVRLLLRLPERDRKILAAFLKGSALDEIAREHGLNRDAARMAIQRAIARARSLA